MVVGPSLELVLMLRDNPHRVKLVLSAQCWVGQNVFPSDVTENPNEHFGQLNT